MASELHAAAAVRRRDLDDLALEHAPLDAPDPEPERRAPRKIADSIGSLAIRGEQDRTRCPGRSFFICTGANETSSGPRRGQAFAQEPEVFAPHVVDLELGLEDRRLGGVGSAASVEADRHPQDVRKPFPVGASGAEPGLLART